MFEDHADLEQVFLSETEDIKLEEQRLNDETDEESRWEPEADDSMLDDLELNQKPQDEFPHEQTRRFPCPECDKTFCRRSAYKTHQASHRNLRSFICPRESCGSAFNVLPRLVRHMRNVHRDDLEESEISELKVSAPKRPAKAKSTNAPSRVQCKVCLKVLSNVKYLKEHMTLQHLKNAPHTCKVKGCGKKFTNWSLMVKHKKQHEGTFDFRCQYCSKGYTQRKILNQHLRNSHQISKAEIDAMTQSDCVCCDCNQTFGTPQKLSDHRALEHGSGEMFICDMCAKVFLSRIKLISHQKYHRGEKKKKCNLCPSIFTEERGLRTHLRRVHSMSENEAYEMCLKL